MSTLHYYEPSHLLLVTIWSIIFLMRQMYLDSCLLRCSATTLVLRWSIPGGLDCCWWLGQFFLPFIVSLNVCWSGLISSTNKVSIKFLFFPGKCSKTNSLLLSYFWADIFLFTTKSMIVPYEIPREKTSKILSFKLNQCFQFPTQKAADEKTGLTEKSI